MPYYQNERKDFSKHIFFKTRPNTTKVLNPNSYSCQKSLYWMPNGCKYDISLVLKQPHSGAP